MKKKEDSVFLTYKKLIQSAIEDLKTKGQRHRQIPNILTLMRLTAPCFIIPAAAVGSVPLVLGMTAFFSLTDFVDGFIARKWHLTSELGETLDAVTDKLFASTLLIAASFSNPLLLCNLGLESVIAGINIYKKLHNESVKSSVIGKLKTWFLFSLVGIGIVSPYFDLNIILNPLMATTTAMQVFTIGSYLFSTPTNKEFDNNEKDNITTVIIPNTDDYEQKKIQKEKVLEVDTTDSKIQNKERKDLKQLKAMREFLISEQVFLEPEENTTVVSVNNVKSKKDDFKI